MSHSFECNGLRCQSAFSRNPAHLATDCIGENQRQWMFNRRKRQLIRTSAENVKLFLRIQTQKSRLANMSDAYHNHGKTRNQKQLIETAFKSGTNVSHPKTMYKENIAGNQLTERQIDELLSEQIDWKNNGKRLQNSICESTIKSQKRVPRMFRNRKL